MCLKASVWTRCFQTVTLLGFNMIFDALRSLGFRSLPPRTALHYKGAGPMPSRGHSKKLSVLAGPQFFVGLLLFISAISDRLYTC